MELSKNDKIELEIDALTSQGSGVGRYNGLAVFVRGTVPGDRIVAHIIKRSRNYAIGIIDEILSPSSQRIESDCACSRQCGGCSFRHMTYDEELKYKIGRVRDAFSRIGHIDVAVDNIIGADDIYHYRNKAQYPVEIIDGELHAGFFAYKSHRIIPCSDCKIQSVEFERGLSAFSRWVAESGVTSYDEKTGKGLLRHIYFRKGFGSGEIMACAVINGDSIPNENRLVELLQEELSCLKSVVLNINKQKTNVVIGDKCKTIWGADTVCDTLLGKKFVISPNSFYQVNHNQCEKLYTLARDFAELNGSETLVDLYCGTGTIGLTMADSVKRIIGIEIVSQAVENAKINAQLNNVDNAEFICADAYQGAEMLKNRGIKPDVIVLDPPRKGCDLRLVDTVVQMAADKIIYVSCDCATLARDLNVFEAKEYKTHKATAVDMFPRTPHVETVVLMSRAKK